MSNIERIPDKFTGIGEVKGFEFIKVKSEQDVAIFSVNNKYHEVVRLKVVPKCINFEKRIYSDTEFKETYPKANKFGIDGFIVKSYSKALDKFNELLNSKNE